jgi:hypothetical protein
MPTFTLLFALFMSLSLIELAPTVNDPGKLFSPVHQIEQLRLDVAKVTGNAPATVNVGALNAKTELVQRRANRVLARPYGSRCVTAMLVDDGRSDLLAVHVVYPA